MWRPSPLHISFALLCILSLFTSCRSDEPIPSDHFVGTNEMIVLETDSTEWHVQIFKEHLFYSEAVAVKLPAPWVIPSREEAAVLRTLSFPHDERFITCDGYTFGMPSASVSKAGQKTKYSVLGLWKRPTTISVQFSRSR